jgi:hypothetical protein
MSDFSALLVDIVLSFDVYSTYLFCGVFGAETLSRCSCPSFHPLNSIALFNIFISILHNFVLEYGNNCFFFRGQICLSFR